MSTNAENLVKIGPVLSAVHGNVSFFSHNLKAAISAVVIFG